VTLRLEQLRQIGHPVDKVELILMGGTMTARSHDYQEWFVKRALEAMNDYDVDKEPEPAQGVSFAEDPDEHEWQYLEDVIAENETADIRNIGTTFETKPDWCDPEQIDQNTRSRRNESRGRRPDDLRADQQGYAPRPRRTGVDRRQPAAAGLGVQGRLPYDAGPARDVERDVSRGTSGGSSNRSSGSPIT